MFKIISKLAVIAAIAAIISAQALAQTHLYSHHHYTHHPARTGGGSHGYNQNNHWNE